jgi:2-oxoglutarate dehydrogenase E2 component (dihydrolipoamide succinyltransferase)
MPHPVTIPAIGESITQGVLARWLAADGAWVDEGKPLYELETDKVSSEVAAEVSGVLRIGVAEGETVDVGGTIAEIDTAAQRPAAAESGGKAAAPVSAPAAVAEASGHAVAPSAKKLLREHSVPETAVAGTGPRGAVTKADAQQHLGSRRPASQEPAPQAESAAAPKAMAAPKSTAKAAEPAKPKASAPGEQRRRMSPLRQRIAQRLVNAQRTAAILSTFNEIDMSACATLRRRHQDEFQAAHGVKLGYMGFFARAVVSALQKHPLINARIDGDEIVEPAHINLGVAVGTDRGLVVPVLKQAEAMSLADIEAAIRAYAGKARDGKLAIEDMEGGTFTITNGGVYGSLLSTPIINPPQSGILGMHAIQDRPVARDGQVVIRPMMYVALSYDHRIVDGADAVGFLVHVKKMIEEPERMLLF